MKKLIDIDLACVIFVLADIEFVGGQKIINIHLTHDECDDSSQMNMDQYINKAEEIASTLQMEKVNVCLDTEATFYKTMRRLNKCTEDTEIEDVIEYLKTDLDQEMLHKLTEKRKQQYKY